MEQDEKSQHRCALGLLKKPLRVAARIEGSYVARWSWMFIHFRLAPCHTESEQQ